MQIHHLNCGTDCPLGGRWMDGHSHGATGHLLCHCLLIETSAGLVLVDTGYGMADVRHPYPRLSRLLVSALNVRFRAEDTALHQVQALGFKPSDVRHILLTHLDFDHAGGLGDFPAATVHVMAKERDAAFFGRRGFVSARRYRPDQFRSVQDWKIYYATGEPWYGFESVRQLHGLPPEILLVPLPGHTRGHAGIAVQQGHRWLLLAGDAYFFHGEMNPNPSCPIGLRLYQRLMEVDRPLRLLNQRRLRDLKRTRGAKIDIICSHDVTEFQHLRANKDSPVMKV